MAKNKNNETQAEKYNAEFAQEVAANGNANKKNAARKANENNMK